MPKAQHELRHCVVTALITLSFNVILEQALLFLFSQQKKLRYRKAKQGAQGQPLLTSALGVKPGKPSSGIQPFKCLIAAPQNRPHTCM